MKIKNICCIGAGYVGGVIVDLLLLKNIYKRDFFFIVISFSIVNLP